MTLTSGSKIGPYEILAPVGAGGMGEVYQARDTRLDRNVAIKVLPEQFSADTKFRERFEREARAISSLNHPNICILYDVGRQDGIDYLVLEYLEGESLAQLLERGPLPIRQVLAYGIQIAEALERAHRQGVVHRDLKPGNVMLTKNGLKLLDFGLAKPMAGASGAVSALGSLTLSQHKPLTAEGTIVGTFQYMSPEQLEGREADPRSDLFAFGCVLYEMATGKRPFDGKTQASVVAAILATEPPPISTLVPLTPPAFERLVKTCVAKDPDERWQTAHDVKLQLQWIAEGGSQAGIAAPVSTHRKHRERTAWAVAAVFVLVSLVAAVAYWRASSAPQSVVRTSILLPEKTQFTLMGRNGVPAISPDGTKVAYVAVREGQRYIWLRNLNSIDAKPIQGTEEGFAPFWSPDGRYLAFFSQGKLKKLAISGGAPEAICDADDTRGGSWGSKDVIVFAANRFSALFSVPASGGIPVQVTELGQSLSHRWPHFLSDGEHFLFVTTPTGSVSNLSNIQLGSIKDKTSKLVLDSGYNLDLSNGQIFFMRDGVLNAQSFDEKRGQVTGEAVPIASDVQVDSLYSNALFSVSQSGMMVYAPSSVSNFAQLAWFDHKGEQTGILGEPAFSSKSQFRPMKAKLCLSSSSNRTLICGRTNWRAASTLVSPRMERIGIPCGLLTERRLSMRPAKEWISSVFIANLSMETALLSFSAAPKRA
jgi:eukaryotic-like serine/threonine-protein kinase